ncbi:hypothetical protein Q7C36_017221 [Tachysurus vachellii]|uniref:CCHC-type domain-containing protein n=1 Tax=Tachysurus vachellii TaxID=175792 RepID=A0AA88M2Z1_TACVA|nr:hypothetical protein Q7C36_017221 [Tachysurus vachellii]
MPKMATQYPLIVKGQQIHYVPWTFMDVTGLVKRLPSVCEGAQKWITKFEEQTMGQSLALGDLKVILCQTVGKAKMIEMFGLAGLGKEANDSRADGITFGPFRNRLWEQLREAYPTKADPGNVEKLKLDEEEGVAQFILKLQESWREEMGASWDETPASMTLFKLMLKRALSAEVQDQLETVVGLNTLPWATFKANVIHHTELHRKRKREAKKAEENLLVQLHKAQLGELTRNKQESHDKKKKEDKEYTKQAAVMVAPAAVQVAPPQDGGAPQVMTQTQPLPPTMIQYPMGYPTSYPVNPQYAPLQRGWGPTRGRGRGGQGRQPPQRPAWGTGGQGRTCWNCNNPGHMKYDCPYLQYGALGGVMGNQGRQQMPGQMPAPMFQQGAGQSGMQQAPAATPQGAGNWAGQWMGPGFQGQAPVPPGGSPLGPAPGGM